MQKIKNIEFLRIIGCIAIILLHMFGKHLFMEFCDIHLYQTMYRMTSNGQKAVDLFFILSGFFFVYKLNTSKSLLEFLKHKFIRLYPVLIFLILLSFIVSCFGIIKFDFYSNLLVLFGFLGTSLKINFKDVHVGVFWYVSSMLWVLGFLYYALKHFDKKYINFILAILIFCSYSMLIQSHSGKINADCPTLYYIFTGGILRAIGGIGIGYFIGEWYKDNIEKINNIKLKLWQTIVVTGLEFCCLYFMIYNLMLHKIKFKDDLIFIIDFAVIIILFLVQKGYISQLFNGNCLGNFFNNISKYTYSFYMVHVLIFDILKNGIYKSNPELIYNSPALNIIFVLGLVAIFGYITYHLVEKPCADYFRKKEAETRMALGGGG